VAFRDWILVQFLKPFNNVSPILSRFVDHSHPAIWQNPKCVGADDA
jgi:hypothetical protein